MEVSKPNKFDRICRLLTAVNVKFMKEINETKQLSGDLLVSMFVPLTIVDFKIAISFE